MCYCRPEVKTPWCIGCGPKLATEKDQAYSERNKLVAILAMGMKIFPDVFIVYRALHDEKDTSWEKDWRNILVIEYRNSDLGVRTPTQAAWHFHDSEFHLLECFPLREDYHYDGHTTEDKYKTLIADFQLVVRNNSGEK